MTYSCEICLYTTCKKANFIRHQNRKKKCSNKLSKCSEICDQVVENVNEVVENVNEVINDRTCELCKKEYSSIYELRKHQTRCKGVDSLTCPVCFLRFENKYKKYRHKRNVICEPPPPPPPPLESNSNSIDDERVKVIFGNGSHNINNTTNNNITNIRDQYNHCNIDNRVQLNIYGCDNDVCQRLLTDETVVEEIKKLIIKEKPPYNLLPLINKVYFNKKYPENHVIEKNVRNNKLLKVHTGDDKWLTKKIDDCYEEMMRIVNKLLEPIVENLSKSYCSKYKHHLNQLGKYCNLIPTLDVVGSIEDKLDVEYEQYPENDDINLSKKEKKAKSEYDKTRLKFIRDLKILLNDVLYEATKKIKEKSEILCE